MFQALCAGAKAQGRETRRSLLIIYSALIQDIYIQRGVLCLPLSCSQEQGMSNVVRRGVITPNIYTDKAQTQEEHRDDLALFAVSF